MPPALHPRSAFTTSLFSTTLALSFIVVGLPHILPCPVDRSQHADGRMEEFDAQGRRRIRRRKIVPPVAGADSVGAEATKHTPRSATAATEVEEDGAAKTPRRMRECPVPKPRGVIGELLGFKQETESEDRLRRPAVRVEAVGREPTSRELHGREDPS